MELFYSIGDSLTEVLGLNPDFSPKFVKRYRELGEEIRSAVSEYAEDVRGGVFPGEEHTVRDKDEPSVRLAGK